MKKIFILSLVLCLAIGIGSAFALDRPVSDNTQDIGGFYGADGVTPPLKILKVRYSLREANAPTLSSGDVVAWDTSSADGITISGCVTAAQASAFAGVLVTTIQTADSNVISQNSRNWGYIGIQGYCLAKVDTSNADTGSALVPNGGTLYDSFGTQSKVVTSQDVGILLSDTASDGLMPVWLK